MVIIILKNKKTEMGCLPEKTTKQARDNQHKTEMNQNLQSNLKMQGQVTPIETTYTQKEQLGHDLREKKMNFTYYEAEHSISQSDRQAIEELIIKYKIIAKEAYYKTNSIHRFNYQPLLTFNPAVDTLNVSERDNLDKTYKINLSKELNSHSRLLLSKR